MVIKENGERRTITKLQAAMKQLINKAASGDARPIREVFKLQAMIAEDDKSTDETVVRRVGLRRPGPFFRSAVEASSHFGSATWIRQD
jgi:hypothetical protein